MLWLLRALWVFAMKFRVLPTAGRVNREGAKSAKTTRWILSPHW